MQDDSVFSEFTPVESEASGFHLYDFIGGATRVAFRNGWSAHALAAGRKIVPKFPPKNEHYLDWVVLLRSVSKASGTFRMAELGAGWGPWLVRAALAARQRSQVSALELLAVEADPQHFAWIAEHFRDNGFDPAQFHLLHGAATSRSEILKFPVITNPDEDYGASLRTAASAKATIDVQGYTIAEVVERFTGPLDFLHIDIQGAEYDCLPPSMDCLARSVKSIMIGTHINDASHNGLAKNFTDAGWREVINLPRNRTSATPWGDIALNDGFLWFTNPSFD